MKVKTARFGEMDIAADRIMTAAARIPGFPNHKQFFIIESAKIAPFKWLQSVEDPELTFVIVEPEAFFHAYSPDIDPEDREQLGLKSMEQAQVYLIVVLPEDMTKMTANLKAPLLVNVETGQFKQVFVFNDEYTHAHSILEAIQAQEKARMPQSQGGQPPEADAGS